MKDDSLAIYKDMAAGSGDLRGAGPAARKARFRQAPIHSTPVLQHSSRITAMTYSKHACQQPPGSAANKSGWGRGQQQPHLVTGL